MNTEPQIPESDEPETMICPACHHPNHPDTKFCRSCGAPIGATAALGPWEQTQAEGFALRQAVSPQRPRLILVLGIWILFLPLWLLSVCFIWMSIRDREWNSQLETKLTTLVFAGQFVLSSAFLYKSAANYRRRKESLPQSDVPESTEV